MTWAKRWQAIMKISSTLQAAGREPPAVVEPMSAEPGASEPAASTQTDHSGLIGDVDDDAKPMTWCTVN